MSWPAMSVTCTVPFATTARFHTFLAKKPLEQAGRIVKAQLVNPDAQLSR
jgi:hypothetical protein